MKKKAITFSRGIFLLMSVIAIQIGATVQAGENDYALLIQSSPPDGGSITPGAGIHQIQIGQTVALSAKPKKGYRFMYWLGDVSKTSGVDTTVSIDSPKLVVAVFSREDFEGELPSTGIIDGQFSPGGGGGRFINPVQNPGSASPASGPADIDYVFGDTAYDFPDYPVFPDNPIDDNDDTNNDDDIPVPEGDDDIPVPGDEEIPEPATIFLLSVGGIAALRRKK